MRVAIVSANGGSGRTTLVLNVAVALSQRRLRTLMVDLDPQGSLGFLLARRDDEWRGLADFLMGRVTLDKAVKRSNNALLSLLPRGRLDPGDAGEFERALGQPRILSAGLRNLERAFDVLLLDPPPGTGMIASGALAVADEVIVTIRADAMAVRSAIRALRMVDRVRRKSNPKLHLAGVLPTFVGERRDLHEAQIRSLKRQGIPVLDCPIPESETFRRASELGQPVARLDGYHAEELMPIGALADLLASRFARGPEPTAAEPSGLPGGHYEHFSARRFRHQPVLPENLNLPGDGATLDLDRLRVGQPFGSGEWSVFLDACLRASAGETAFAMDSDGLILASRGRLAREQATSVGTRLTAALDHSRRMEISGGGVQTALVEFEHQWLTGVAVEREPGKAYTIGVLAREPVPPSVRTDIRNTLTALLAGVAIRPGEPAAW